MPTWNIIYGLPGETEEDYCRMADLVPSLTHLNPPGLVRLQVHRFSPYFDEPSRHGLRLLGPTSHYGYLYDVAPNELADLAYSFDYEYLDGHDAERVVAPLKAAVEEWYAHWIPGRHRSLRYERGPGFLRIRDRRIGTENRDFLFDDVEAELYLACLTGCSPTAAANRVERQRSIQLAPDEVRGFFDELTDARLLFREGDWFLSLALPLTPDADPPAILGPQWKLSLPVMS